MAVKLKDNYLKNFINDHELSAIEPQVLTAHNLIHDKSGPGNDFLGWVDLPDNYDREEFSRIKSAAQKIRKKCDVLIVIGIGGSYLGSRAVIEALKSPLYNLIKKDTPEIYFAGNNINPSYISQLLSICEGRDVAINVISKSGTTTEPAIAFRIFKEYLENKYGVTGARERIICTTDKAKGTLKELAEKEGYQTFIVPDDIGGRFSVLSAVGLFPIAVSGIDIDLLMNGALKASKDFAVRDINNNDCYKYAALRNILYRKGKSIEILVSYDYAFSMMSEWWKQLFGESEGKDSKGIFPASVTFSTDLHSLGQFIQQGTRNIFETVINIKNPVSDIVIKSDESNCDGLNFLAGKTMSYINQKAFEGTILAHNDGGVPNIVLEIEKMDEFTLGYLIYFFEKACAVSGYLLGVNPFDQPGVEAYKKNMFALLGKPGFEDQRAALEKLINN